MIVESPSQLLASVGSPEIIGGVGKVNIDNRGLGYTKSEYEIVFSAPTTSGLDLDGDDTVDLISRQAKGYVTILGFANEKGGKLNELVITDPGLWVCHNSDDDNPWS